MFLPVSVLFAIGLASLTPADLVAMFCRHESVWGSVSQCHLVQKFLSRAIALTFTATDSTKNLAIKINAKLANPFHLSSSWKIKGPASDWLERHRTLVIGYAFASGKTMCTGRDFFSSLNLMRVQRLAQGRDGKMVVVASSCVDDQGLSMRHANIVLPKSPYMKPVAAEKLISVRAEIDAIICTLADIYFSFLVEDTL